MLKRESGITLIALIITIIVLLILAGISIASLTGSGLFSQAQRAKQEQENSQIKENTTLAEYEMQLQTLGTVGNLKDTEDTKPIQALPTGAQFIETDATKGIVIVDSNDNEWVWVEVPKTAVFKTAKSASEYNSIKTDLINYATDYREGLLGQGRNWIDEYYEGCGVVATETKTAEEVYTEKYNKMLSSVYTNGGFWISRYEIGDATATQNNETRTENSGTTQTTGAARKAVSKANQIPYNFVTCSQAQTIASGMATDLNKTSSLLFGIQWDLVCKFLEVNGDWDTTTNTASYYINSNSTSWGNYNNSSLTLRRGKYNISPYSSTSLWTPYTTDTENYVISAQTSNNSSYHQLLTTGASEGTNIMNIYDFAGNEMEWTLEHATFSTSEPCAFRGGIYYYDGSGYPASRRDYTTTSNSEDDIAFRSALY